MTDLTPDLRELLFAIDVYLDQRAEEDDGQPNEAMQLLVKLRCFVAKASE